MIYNFNISLRSGKTYYEENKAWKDIKIRIKNILDSKQSDRYSKILEIQSLLDYYKSNYFKGE